MLYITLILTIIILAILFYKTKQRGGGFGEYNRKKREEIEKAKEEIMKMFEAKEKLTNKDIRRKLKISDATTVRYLDELENEGKVKFFDKSKFSYYEKK